jgi:hypothetical protein
MPTEPGEPKQPFVANLELMAKLSTAVLGVLYVLGLLISNIQLMSLGISDFSSIQTRNVLTGFGFIFYLVLLCLVFLLIGFVLFMVYQTIKSGMRAILKFAIVIGLVGTSIYVILNIVHLIGLVEGYFIVYDKTWNEAGNEVDVLNLNQFRDLYFHYKIETVVVVSVIFLLVFVPIALHSKRRGVIIMISCYLILVLPLLLFDYADEVYPNVRYNLGGGQPQVAR